MTEPVNVLWTSGWDSTFRVADLLLTQGRVVQPWYVVDAARRSSKTELRTMDQIRQALSRKDTTVADRLLPTKIVRIEDIPVDQEVSLAYKNLAREGHLGTQYDWLARLAKSEAIQLELSIHCDDKAHAFLEGHTQRDELGRHYLSGDFDNGLELFKWFSFPLFDISKLDMEHEAQENGFADIMEMTWFCFVPLRDGRPCGFCNPCKYTREEGMGRRIPAPTLARRVEYLTRFGRARINNIIHNHLLPLMKNRR